MVMLLAYTRWFDHRTEGPTKDEVLWRFLLTLALWPCRRGATSTRSPSGPRPLPFTTENIRSPSEGSDPSDGVAPEPVRPRSTLIAVHHGPPSVRARRHRSPRGQRRPTHGDVLRRTAALEQVHVEHGFGRSHVARPNIATQAVQWPQHLFILREAWTTGLQRTIDASTSYLEQLRHPPTDRCAGLLRGSRWPVYLVIWLGYARGPDDTPRRPTAAWTSLIQSRLMLTLGPQLDTSGFLVRPLCLDDPFVLLLWPRDSTWTRWSPREYLLPLRDRLMDVTWWMIWEAHRGLWPTGSGEGFSPVEDLVPTLELHDDLEFLGPCAVARTEP